jgi:hypothetical protein
MPRWPGFLGPSYESVSRMLNGEVTMNFIPEIVTGEAPFAKARGAFYPIPGIVDFARGTDAPGRAIFREDSGRLFAVTGAKFGEISAAGVWTPRGDVLVDGNPAQIASNGSDQVFVVSGTKGYLLVLSTNTFTNEVSDVTMCASLDTFFLTLDAVTGTMQISEGSDGTTWDPTQVQNRSAMPDPWTALTVARKEIILIGGKSGEAWFNDGGSPFPFTLRPGSVFDVGIEANFTLVPFGGSVAWLGSGDKGPLGVYTLNGYEPYKISTLAVDWALQQYRDTASIENALAWSYERLGHSFYVLDIPSVGKTWVYDKTTNQWHERGRWNGLENQFVHYRPRFYADCFRHGLILDGEGDRIYRFSESVYTDVGGGVLRRVRRTPSLPTENRQITIDYLEVEAQRGVGLAAGQGSDPLLMIQLSWNGGATWGNERTVSLGQLGHYDQRIRIDKWGTGRNPQVQIACTDPVPSRLFDLYYGKS